MKEYLQSFNILSDKDIEIFEHLVTRRTLKKGDFFIQEGMVCKEVAFIVSGLFRSFYYSSSDEDVTYCFTFENSFLTAYSSLISQVPTEENIQALTDVEMLCVSKAQIDELEQTNLNWLRLMKHIAEQEYIKMEKRVFLLQRENAEKRYQDLLENSPKYLQHIPLNYLSSYLGITQRHLSRIRSSIAN